ncbi:hypothetical protein DPEC_G00300620 [Dallia pectoralis]|uniref:Uncharacterized protein n=1 Tax=Dallia pectoralis TaxID=75939 RepID=A0ACC2FGM8_DALPE|nr:hypothetical protein DPEC_G00300620 [Dallia pectoralis]
MGADALNAPRGGELPGCPGSRGVLTERQGYSSADSLLAHTINANPLYLFINSLNGPRVLPSCPPANTCAVTPCCSGRHNINGNRPMANSRLAEEAPSRLSRTDDRPSRTGAC